MSPSKKHLHDLLLLLVTFFWGSTFILVKKAVAVTDVFSFLGIRFALAAAILAAALGRRWRLADRRLLFRGGLLGAVLYLSYAFQTVGLSLTTAANAGFITVFLATIFAFVIQTAAQRVVSPTGTALIFTMEPVFAALFAWLYGGEKLTAGGLAGGGLILAGMIVAELCPREWPGFGGTAPPCEPLKI